MKSTNMKKWWMIAAVFALALSLTSCSRRGSSSNYGLNYCDGTMGQFDVYTVAVPNQPGTYKVVVDPISLSAAGDVVSITVVNQTSLAYKELVQQVVVYVNQRITAGYISEAELQNYNLIAITTYMPGVDFLGAQPAKDAICGLPLLGDGR
ncbi:hypothetical protein K2X33_08910 [bacterium]|nr:hypothetical protein [bacterium]